MIGHILLGALLALLFFALLAPNESMHWWATQSLEESERRAERVHDLVAAERGGRDEHTSYIVYISGVGAFEPEASLAGERPLLDAVRTKLDGIGLVSQIYPYSMTNQGLLEARLSSWWWRIVHRHTYGGPMAPLARIVINVRNALQVLVSLDRRYGPLYSLGIANVIWDELLDAGYHPADKRPIVLLSWSGGAQIALGASWYLAATGAPVHLMSVGGFMDADPGLDKLTHLWHFKGSRDWVQGAAGLFPGRWAIRPKSSWNRALADGRLTIRSIGPLKHLGRGSYLSNATKLPDGSTGREITVQTICSTLVEAGLATWRAPGTPPARVKPANRPGHPRRPSPLRRRRRRRRSGSTSS
ncbi:hypothetical protein [Raineyella sp. LH-20]|uniref:hypothetical protein n=1 Tax=Raineyella sp. LH-20 TaxID=3081204 RepID=UPI002953316C|nr:hypothetical protein [Raineyella sp. LH-20]WOP18184.1 hypothetical protein R0146_13255 [Raineyella sp. LH-20]